MNELLWSSVEFVPGKLIVLNFYYFLILTSIVATNYCQFSARFVREQCWKKLGWAKKIGCDSKTPFQLLFYPGFKMLVLFFDLNHSMQYGNFGIEVLSIVTLNVLTISEIIKNQNKLLALCR